MCEELPRRCGLSVLCSLQYALSTLVSPRPWIFLIFSKLIDFNGEREKKIKNQHNSKTTLEHDVGDDTEAMSVSQCAGMSVVQSAVQVS